MNSEDTHFLCRNSVILGSLIISFKLTEKFESFKFAFKKNFTWQNNFKTSVIFLTLPMNSSILGCEIV